MLGYLPFTLGIPGGDDPSPPEGVTHTVSLGTSRDLRWVTTGARTLSATQPERTLTFIQADRILVTA